MESGWAKRRLKSLPKRRKPRGPLRALGWIRPWKRPRGPGWPALEGLALRGQKEDEAGPRGNSRGFLTSWKPEQKRSCRLEKGRVAAPTRRWLKLENQRRRKRKDKEEKEGELQQWEFRWELLQLDVSFSGVLGSGRRPLALGPKEARAIEKR